MTAYSLGVDIGTGSTKAVAISDKSEVLFTKHVSYPTLQPEPGHSEQDPEVVWNAFATCISESIKALGSPQFIALSSAMHSLVAVDRQGNPLSNLILWSDNRAASIAKRIRSGASGEMLYEQNGTPIHAMTPLCKLIWLQENNPTLVSNTHKFISIKEYVWFKLFHDFEIDHSIASATGLFNIDTLRWNDTALHLCDITEAKLSKPVPTSHQRKNVTDSALNKIPQLTKAVPFIIGASDGCMANLGSFATRPGVAALTIGTSGAVRVFRKSPVYNFESMPFNYRLDENSFISGGPINNGGIALRWYAQHLLGKDLSKEDAYDDLLKNIADIPPGCDGLVFLPYILGERAPIWNSESSGVFFGITARHTRDHFTRAVLEGICMSLFQVARSLEDTQRIDQIHASGGFVKSAPWVQILADVLGKTIRCINTGDASAIGAIYLGWKALGQITSFDDLKPGDSVSFDPSPEAHQTYIESVIPKYERLYKSLKEEMALGAK